MARISEERIQEAPLCEDCGQPCFPSNPAVSKVRRTRCHACKSLLCSFCYDTHRLANENDEPCTWHMQAKRAEGAIRKGE